MDENLNEWLLRNTSEPARVKAEFHAYVGEAEEVNEVRIRILEYVPGALGEAPERKRLRFYAEVRSMDGKLLDTSNPDETAEFALLGLHLQMVTAAKAQT